jgi:hypothetical protein
MDGEYSVICHYEVLWINGTFMDMSLPLHTFVSNRKKERLMEFVCIEAKTFMEMNEALEAIARRVHETCGGSTRGMDEWIDNQEACTLMDVSPRKMLQLRRSGSIPYSYIDRKVYYKRQDIIRFMEAEIHRVTPLNRMI